MNERFRTVLNGDLAVNVRRPLIWILIVVLGALTFGLATGNVSINSGDSTVGGESRAWMTSEFNVAFMFPIVAFLGYIFFIAVAAGMAVPRDEELGVGAILHSTKLTSREYIWGKFLAALLTFLGVLAIHLLLQMIANHVVPNPNADKIRGPFELANYLRPAFILTLPTIIFFSGVSFAIGARWRKPILVFVTPVAALLICIFFLWDWSPSWLDPRLNRFLMWIEPSGFRWLNETWLLLDRGVEFYNTTPVGYDLPFLLSRLAYVAIGFFAVWGAERSFTAGLRGVRASRFGRWRVGAAEQAAAPATALEAALTTVPLKSIGMITNAPSFLRTVLDVARFETANLRGQPGLYIFVPLILLQTIGTFAVRTGAFDTPLLLTPGFAATASMNTLTLLVSLLLLFYTVESVVREKNVGLSSIYYATPARTAAMLFGKALANGFVGVVILLGALLGAVIVMLWQRQVPLDLGPFVLTWGLLLVPTFVVWATFVATIYAITDNRYATYGLGLGVLMLTGWLQSRGDMHWVGNWSLWSAVTWTDFGSFEPNIQSLLLNRVFYLAVMAFLVALTVRIFPRREHDSARVLDRLRPKSLLMTAVRLSPVALPAVILGTLLYVQVGRGFQSEAAEIRAEDYWARNLNTWQNVEPPRLTGVELDVTLDPMQRSFAVEGSYKLTSYSEEPMRRIPMSVGDHFEDVEWTLNGEEFEPENRAKLHIFDLEPALAPGDTITLGFSHHGEFPKGSTKNGGGVGNFVLPVGVVLTSFNTGFVPLPFFEDGRGVDSDNDTEPKDWDDDFYEGVTRPALGSGARFPVRTTIHGPPEYQYHGVGIRESETVEGEVRTVVWNTDHPVNFFNIVAAKWDKWEGDGVEIYHHPRHTYNLEEMGEALEASRRYYSEWFYEYPWEELKLSEFPGLSSYAQGFPTNITFSESIGFLTRSSEDANVAFLVTAHEAAHQWWGNILLPGEGPGGNILAEGTSHFSTILLQDEVKGPQARINFLKQIEENYGERRRVDSERPLYRNDNSKAGDGTVTYDKGGWVFWMLHNLMGREANLAGIQEFMATYAESDDFPVLQDFVRVLRPHAPDPQAFDQFVAQWFDDVVVPRYVLDDIEKIEHSSGGWSVAARIENQGTGTMPVVVAATSGTRFDSDEKRSWERDDFLMATETIELAAGESVDIEIECDFEPDRLVVDPDATVLMLQRDQAERAL